MSQQAESVSVEAKAVAEIQAVRNEVKERLDNLAEIFQRHAASNRFSGVSLEKPHGADIKCSGVVAQLWKDDDGFKIALLRRPHTMRAFPGSIVIPGGKADPGEDGVAAGTREFREEMGVDLLDDEVVAVLPNVYRSTGDKYYEITPQVSFVAKQPDYSTNPDEGELEIFPLTGPDDLIRASADRLSGATRFIYEALHEALSVEKYAEKGLTQLQIPNSSLKIVVTSGGTRVPIDTVRELTNKSMGTTGAYVAQSALQRGHFVHYLCARDARRPFQAELSYDTTKPRAAEQLRLNDAIDRFAPLFDRAAIERADTFDRYRSRLLELVKDPTFDAAIVAMAASDYGPVEVQGKIRSDAGDLLIECRPLPKIISEIKKERRGIFLVGFKLLINEAPDKLIEIAYRNMLRDGQDLSVANVGADSMKPKDLLTYIVTPERGVIPVERDALPETLVRLVEERYSKRHFSTRLTTVDALPVPTTELAEFASDIRRLANLSIFPAFASERREEFGFVAKRTEAGTLITARGSSKSDADVEDVSVVTAVDLEKLTLDVSSMRRKASLNASLAHLIMEARPEVNYIVHAHIPLPGAARVTTQTTPSTAEDWESIAQLVHGGASLIEQPHHGVLILLERLDDVYSVLEKNSVYLNRAEHYDAAYHRFLDNARLIDLVEINTASDAKVLDLACGTGEVTKRLLARGFSDIDLMDMSPAMLRVARDKLAHVLNPDRFQRCTIQELPPGGEYQAIVLRQAINYLSPDDLEAGLKRMRDALAPGGKLFFNSFDPASVKEGLTRAVRDEVDNRIMITHAGNSFHDGKLYHGQRTEIFDAYSGDYELVYDLNSFWPYSPETFEAAARNAGFDRVEIHREGNSVYFICGKEG